MTGLSNLKSKLLIFLPSIVSLERISCKEDICISYDLLVENKISSPDASVTSIADSDASALENAMFLLERRVTISLFFFSFTNERGLINEFLVTVIPRKSEYPPISSAKETIQAKLTLQIV